MKTILVAIDFSDITSTVVEKAIYMAKKLDAKLYLVHTEPPELDYVAYGLEQAYVQVDNTEYREENRNILHKIEEDIKAEELEVESILLKGPTAEIITQEAKDISADLIIIGTHEHGSFYHLFFGSTRDSIIQESHVPILVVPPEKKENK